MNAVPPTPPWGAPPAPQGAGRQGPGSRSAASLRRARLRRRTAWLLVTAPVVVGLVVLGLKLALLAPIASFARSDYDDGAHLDAAGTYGSQRTLNLVDPWKAHFNTGTANARSEDVWALYDAIDGLDRAYRLAEEEPAEVRCAVQTNLSLAYEISGDHDAANAQEKADELGAVEDAIAARAAGRPYDEAVLDPYGDGNEVDPEELRQDVQDWYEYAERSYATAEQVRGWPDCGESEQTPEEQQQAAAALQRLEEKQQQARESQPEEQEGEGRPEDGQGEPEQGEQQPDAADGQSQAERDAQEEQERRQRLQEQSSEAREQADREQQELRELYGDETGGGDDAGEGTTKNW
ncbi:hypothetical protein [Cellulosimicrobium sp. CUA-896]|uniref:hypothetical protein n=1 Tax=Cellulosimicrobium sp. CUA-896 TaxID=1517881 RepID=UPI00095B83D3|nr:hypothetical protein [Cellulosimicrobium sp. CUA-896]OLT54569.1 hypothetical protein BJF88_08665 [Cellulosimicrobium sp. CUA-896]